MALRLGPSFSHPLISSSVSLRTTRQIRRCSIRSCIEPNNSRKLVLEVKEKLEKEYPSLPLGRNGRDDEDMIFWFLKDRRFSVEEAVSKLTKAIEFDPSDDRKLCVFLIEKALSRLPTGNGQILGIVDLRGYRTENADLKFLTFFVRFSNQLLKLLLKSSLCCHHSIYACNPCAGLSKPTESIVSGFVSFKTV